jgi:hypothetical protein
VKEIMYGLAGGRGLALLWASRDAREEMIEWGAPGSTAGTAEMIRAMDAPEGRRYLV